MNDLSRDLCIVTPSVNFASEQDKEKFKSTTIPILMANYGLAERQQIQNPYQIVVKGR